MVTKAVPSAPPAAPFRSDMGDVHGTNPALRQIIYVVLKAGAALISGLLTTEH